MKFVIIGRTATGKTRLAKELEASGLRVLKTSTTRPCRGPEDDGYNFLTPQEAASIPIEKKLLLNTIGNAEYFTTIEDLEKADVCILDPTGYETLTTILPMESLHVIHAVCGDMVAQKTAALSRAADPVAEEAVFNQRQMDENAVFSKFEQDVAAKTTFGQNIFVMHQFVNDYNPQTVANAVRFYLGYFQMFKNMATIVRQALSLGILSSVIPDGEHVDVAYATDGAPRKETVPLEVFVDIALNNADNLASLVTAWLANDGVVGEPKDMPMDAALQQMADNAFAEDASNASDEALFEALKSVLFMHGSKAIADFLDSDYPKDEDKDATDRRLDEAYAQMPNDEYAKFLRKYGLIIKDEAESDEEA